MLDLGLLLYQVFITYQEILHVESIQYLLHIATAISCVFYRHLVVSRSSLWSCIRQNNKQPKHLRSTCVLLKNRLGAPLVLHEIIILAWELHISHIYGRTNYDPTTCYTTTFLRSSGQPQGIASEQPVSSIFFVQITFETYYVRVTWVPCHGLVFTLKQTTWHITSK